MKIEVLTRDQIREAIGDIARLRIDIFREYPYLYDGDYKYESKYLNKLIDTPDSIVVVLRDDGRIVGAMTGLPLAHEADGIQLPWKERGSDVSKIYYFSEILVYPDYRKMGLGNKIFDLAEDTISKLEKYDYFSLATVVRPPNHQSKPVDYKELDGFWEKKGYTKQPHLICHISWKEIGENEESNKPLVFWVKKNDLTIELSNVELHAEVLRQNHRWFSILRNFWVERKKYAPEDPRYNACRDALIYKIVGMLLPTAVYSTIGITGALALIISIQTLLSAQEQNVIESRAFLFDHAREIQKVFLEYPELYPYFYSNKEVSKDIDPKTRVRIDTVAEMITDMLDNAAGSRIKDLSEGWSEYANYMYTNGPAFRNFYIENKDWYPKVNDLLTMKEKPKEETLLDKVKHAISEL